MIWVVKGVSFSFLYPHLLIDLIICRIENCSLRNRLLCRGFGMLSYFKLAAGFVHDLSMYGLFRQ